MANEARPRERLAELARLVVGEPRSIPLRLDLATALIELGRRDEGVALLRDIAMAFAEDGHLIQAIAVCRGILDLDPTHQETLDLLATFVERRGDRPSAFSRLDAEQDELGAEDHTDATMPASATGELAGVDDPTHVGAEPTWQGAPRVATPLRHGAEVDTENEFAAIDGDDHDHDDGDATSAGARPAVKDPDDDTDAARRDSEFDEPTSPGVKLANAIDEEAPPDPVAEALLRSASYTSMASAELPPFPLLSELPSGAFVELLREISLVDRGAGEVLVEEGSPGDAFYLIAEGTVRVRKGSVEVALLGPGSFFGEFAVLADQRRHATVESVTSVRLVEVTRALLDRLVADHPGVARTLRAFYGDRLLATLLQTAPFFAELNPEERAEVATRFRPRRFGRGTTIIEEGGAGGGLYLILVGEVEVVRNDAAGVVELGRLGEGSYFGEMSLLKGAPASATVRAARLCETVQLPPRDFYEIVSRHPVLWDQLRNEAQERELVNVAILAGEARGTDDGSVYLV